MEGVRLRVGSEGRVRLRTSDAYVPQGRQNVEKFAGTGTTAQNTLSQPHGLTTN